MTRKIESNLIKAFLKAAEEAINKEKEIRRSYEREVLPLIEKICSFPEKDGGKFRRIEQKDDKDFLMGVEYLVENAVVNSVSFSTKESGNFNLSSSSSSSFSAVQTLGKWMADVAPERVPEIGMLEENNSNTFPRLFT